MIKLIFMLFACCFFATVILISNPKNSSIRWCSLLLYVEGGGVLSNMIVQYVLPQIGAYTQNSLLLKFIYQLSVFLSFLSFHFAAFLLLMFSLNYSGLLEGKALAYKNKLALLLMSPFMLLAVLYPTDAPCNDHLRILILSLMVAPYGAVSIFLLIRSFLKETNPWIKMQRLITCTLIIPPSVFCYITSCIGPVLYIYTLWKIEFWAVIPIFAAFVFFSAKYGVLGFRIRFEKYDIANTMMTISSSTSLMNHAIKNEIIKINMCAENINIYSNADKKELNTDAVNRNAQIILAASKHTLDIVARIQEYMQTIKLKESVNNLGKILDKSLSMLTPYFESQQIEIIKNYDESIDMVFDSMHIQEVFSNILRNAVEAMKSGGRIQIKSSSSKKKLTIEIRDNGDGIEKEDLSKVFKPFFSTKKSDKNSGLGLSYCYNVMQMHGGSIDIYSKKNLGTTVYLNFPSNKLINYKPT